LPGLPNSPIAFLVRPVCSNPSAQRRISGRAKGAGLAETSTRKFVIQINAAPVGPE